MSNNRKFLIKSLTMAGLVAGGLLTLPVIQASAQERNPFVNAVKGSMQHTRVARNRGGNDVFRGGGNRDRGYNRGYRHGYNDRGYRNRNRAYNRGYNRGYRHGNRNNGAALVTGLFGGALLYSAFNQPRYNSHTSVSYSYSSGYPYNYYGTSYHYNPGYHYRPRTNVVYVQQPVQTVVQPVYAPQPVYNNQPVYTNQQQGAAPSYQYQPQQAQNSSCLQTREYTTTIEVGGQTVPAYGQACLQPDGSWKFGDPVATPTF